MKQSRIDSAMEVAVNIAIGMVVAGVTNAVVLPGVLGVPLSRGQNFTITAIFTGVSVVRSYAIRRLFNGRSPWMWLREHWSPQTQWPRPRCPDCRPGPGGACDGAETCIYNYRA